ncbi:hypothetical protein [Methanobacterium formicicum]|uniref:Uncharacterized protein n=1 Tax=Methanobacterium formicicum TaxID=2162 RepID=A0A843AKQ2_METFO|nr:hypothetical protein [Methanobacterium formicicum]MBF4475777.1 hypothetical protein [Methanobacterium formicicum]
MNKTQNLQMKLTFLAFTLLMAVIISGAASAGLELPEQSYTSAYVVENGYTFTGSTSINDAANNFETMDGNHVEIETGVHEEQVTVNKNLNFTGVGANPQDTVIQSNSESGTVIISTGMSVVLENLSIWNYGTGEAVVNNGLLNIVNCYVNGVYIENQVTGSLPDPQPPEEDMEEPNPEGTTETMVTEVTTTPETTIATEEAIVTGGVTETIDLGTTNLDETGYTTETTTNTIEGSTTGSEGSTGGAAGTETQSTDDPGIPLASLASGMLMVMGGTVVSGRKHP